jgi:Zn-finger protein
LLVHQLIDNGYVQGDLFGHIISLANKQYCPLYHLENDDKKRIIDDLETGEYLKKVLDDEKVESYNIIETRGGYHILINKLEFKKNKNLYKNLDAKLMDTNLCTKVTSHGLAPIPGTLQYGFPVKFYAVK